MTTKLSFTGVEFPSGVYDGTFELGSTGVIGTDESPGTIEEGVETGRLQPPGVNAGLAVFDRIAGTNVRDGQQISISLSATHAWDVEVVTPTDTVTKDDGSLLQWGSTADDTVTELHSATGADKETQVAVLMEYVLRASAGDSLNTATLEVYPRSSDGPFDPVDVSVQNPSGVITSTRSTTADISLRLVEAADIDEAIDVVEREA